MAKVLPVDELAGDNLSRFVRDFTVTPGNEALDFEPKNPPWRARMKEHTNRETIRSPTDERTDDGNASKKDP
jgi:hypothetical protein